MLRYTNENFIFVKLNGLTYVFERIFHRFNIFSVAVHLSQAFNVFFFFRFVLHCIQWPASITAAIFFSLHLFFANHLARRKIVNQNYQLDVTTLRPVSLSLSISFSPTLSFERSQKKRLSKGQEINRPINVVQTKRREAKRMKKKNLHTPHAQSSSTKLKLHLMDLNSQ